MTDNIELPPLPYADFYVSQAVPEDTPVYTDDQARAYARAAILADRARQAPAPVEVSRLARVLTELVELKDMKERLKKLHAMGHGTDYTDYYKRQPLAWEAARAVLASMASIPAAEVPAGWLAKFDAVAKDFSVGRWGRFGAEGAFEAVAPDNTVHQDARWIGGSADLRLLRAVRAAMLATSSAPAASKGSEAVACERCGGRDIPWGYGKCHCFKTTEDTNDREHHGADAESAPQVGGADAGSDRSGVGSGANVGDEHRSPTAAPVRSAGYSLGDGVRLPDRREIQEGIDLTPTPEPLDRSLHSPTFAAPSEPEAQKAVAPLEWTAKVSSDGRQIVVDSADFEHDALLILHGDFGSMAGKLDYAKELADKLNATPSPTASMEVQGLGIAEMKELAQANMIPGHAIAVDFVGYGHALQRALAAKNGWRLGEGRG